MTKKAVQRIKKENEFGARRAILEDLFFDFNVSRKQVYWMNFIRGLFFGFGSILGGTLLIALFAWLLSLLVDVPGGVGEFIQFIVNSVQKDN